MCLHPDEVTRSASDDLESLLYIFIEFVSTYPMPGSPPDHDRLLVPWHEPSAMRDWTLSSATKEAFLWSPEAESSIFTKRYLKPYFQVESIEDVILHWRLLFKRRDQEGSNHEVTHEKVRMVLERGLRATPSQDEPLPLPPSSSTPAASLQPGTSGPQSVPPRRTNPKRNRK